jgi:DNA-binding transcriptional ArsR family regulator
VAASTDGIMGDAIATRASTQIEPRIHRMLGHPLRYEIIMKLGERPWTPTELSEALDESLKRISEQIEILGREGLIELVDKQPGPRGGMVHTYRSVRFVFAAEEWESLPALERETASLTISRMLVGEIARALETGSFDSHPNRALLRRPVWTDDQGVREIEQLMGRTDAEIHAIEQRSLERRQLSAEPPIRLMTAQLSFPVAPEDLSTPPE